MERIRVAVVEKDSALRLFLRELIDGAGNAEVVIDFGDVQQALPRLGAYRPKVIVADLDCPATLAPGILERLAHVSDKARLLAIAEDHEQTRLRALETGAHGFVSKDFVTRWLCEAVQAVANDRLWINGRIIDDLESELAYLRRRTGGPEPKTARLSRRHRELLTLAAQGWTNERIARILGRSIHTVNHHFTRIFTELGVDNRTEAVARAQVEGLLLTAALEQAAEEDEVNPAWSFATGRG
jgi:DNA-binding NarL/FixJ family response regulator